MKDNTGQLKNYLLQALAHSPDDFSLVEAKKLIMKAIDLVEDVEKKRSIRENNYQKRKQLSNIKYNSNAMELLNKELDMAKAQLAEIENRKTAFKKNNDDEGSEMQNVFG